jgi:hypothetical protein
LTLINLDFPLLDAISSRIERFSAVLAPKIWVNLKTLSVAGGDAAGIVDAYLTSREGKELFNRDAASMACV